MRIIRTTVGLGSIAPSTEFFHQLRTKAQSALSCAKLTETQAWDLCEFGDCRYSGDIAASGKEREACVLAIGRFLESASPKLFRKFYRGSFSARGHSVDFNHRELAFG